MPDRIIATGFGGLIGCRWSPARTALIVVEWAGRLLEIHPDGTSTVLGTGYVEPEDVLLLDDGTTAVVSEKGGDVVRVDLSAADRSTAIDIVTGLQAPHQLAVAPDGTGYAVEYAGGRLLSLPPGTTTPAVVATGLDRPAGLVLDPAGGTGYVSEQGGGTISRVDLSTGAVSPVLTGLEAPFFLAWGDAAGTQLLVAERDPANRIGVVDLGGTTPVHRVLGGTPFRPSSAVLDGTDLYVACDREVAMVDVSAGLTPSVRFTIANPKVFVGSYQRVPVQVAGPVVDLDDLDIAVAEGSEAGAVSPSRDATFRTAHPDVVLVGGSVPGRYTVVATERASGRVLGKARFDLTSAWTEVDGPPLAFIGSSEPWATGGAWGGGGAGPQIHNVLPASGTRRVAVVLVDTSSSRYPTAGTTVADHRTLWSNELLGTAADADGVRRSVHHYFQEVSDGRFDVSLVGGQVYGPYHLSGDWKTHFDWNKDRKAWWYKGALFQAVVTAAQDDIDFGAVDSLVVVVNSLSSAVEPGTSLFCWPVAGGGNMTYRRPGTLTTSNRTLRALTMPVDWQTVDGRRIHETLSHEIGHNLGLPDLYMNVTPYDSTVAARDVRGWDLMSRDDPLPHPCLAHKLMLGWAEASLVESFDFAHTGGVDRTITLQATEALNAPVPAGRCAGVEVQRAAGWSYFFEYRAAQGNDIADHQLEADRRVLGTDVISSPFAAPQERRSIILLPMDPDGDGPVLPAGADYEEPDPSGPATFQFDVLSTTADTAQVRVRYGGGGRPDPSIRPWPGGAVWQSPDIEVRNGKSAVDSKWLNVPWAGHSNTVVAKVHNGGNFVAKGVWVDFLVKDFSITGAPEVPIGSDRRDVPVGTTVEFSTGWTPPANTPTQEAHYCVVVRIRLHQDPGNPAIVELTELNNVAQSNYTRFVSSSASPSTRGITSVVVENPYPERTRAWIVAQQSADYYRTYIGHQWLWLEPGQTRAVEVMYESLAGDPTWDAEIRERYERFYEVPNRLSVIGLLEDPRDELLHTAAVAGGANVVVASARRTEIVDLEVSQTLATGRVVTVDDSAPVDRGAALATLQPDGRPDEETVRTGSVEADGTFVLELGIEDGHAERGTAVQVHYLGAFDVADCDSDVQWIEP